MIKTIYLPFSTEQILKSLPFLGKPKDFVVPLINREDIIGEIKIINADEYKFELPTAKLVDK